MPRVEQTLASYLSPGVASSLKAPVLPSKPLRTTSALVGKGYAAAGQAGACLHTMSVLQAYQADLLKELDEGEQIKSDDIVELRRTADLALHATKETARAIGRCMAALVAAERHLWLTLSDMKDKDRVFLMDTPLAPSGLFGNAINSVVDRYQEARKQGAAFQRFLPRRSIALGAAGREQPQPCTSSSYREVQKQSVASRAPPQRDRGRRRSKSGASKARPDLRVVLQSGKPSTKINAPGWSMPEGKPASHDQGHAAMTTCLGHVEETLVLDSGPGAGSSLSPRNARDRFVPHRLGSGHEWPPCPRSVEWSPSHVAHQLPGNAGRVSSTQTLSSRPERSPCVGAHRQHSGGLLHKPPGRSAFAPLIQAGAPDPCVVSGQTSFTESSAYSWVSQCGSRHPVEAGAEARGMDASPRGGEADMESFWPGPGGFVCDSSDIALSPLVLSDSSSSTGAGCYGTDLAEASSVRFFPRSLCSREF